jgi:hypothetical protein
MEAGNILGVVANYTRILNNWQNEMALPHAGHLRKAAAVVAG